MKIEEIIGQETGNTNQIHLVRDRLFWQAWEMSAFLFVNYFRPYQVHHKHFVKVGQDFVWLGFPKSVLISLENEAKAQGAVFEMVNEDHAIIRGLPAKIGFESWKAKTLQGGAAKPQASVAVLPSPSIVSAGVAECFLPAYKQAYDLTLHVFRASVKIAKEFRYSLGERIRLCVTELLESLHLLVNKLADSQRTVELCMRKAQSLRIDLRLLKDLRQVNIKQWGFLNQELETLLQCLWPESRSPRPAGASHLQSSDPLPLA